MSAGTDGGSVLVHADRADVDRPHVLVTGAAGAIGSATVRQLLGRGYRVIGLDRRDEVVGLVEDEAYSGVCGEAADVGVLEGLVSGLDRLVCVAGGALPQEVGDPRRMADAATWEATLRDNLTGPYLAVLACRDLLEASSGDASVTFVSSINATDGFGLAAYSAAKAGLLGLVAGLLGLVAGLLGPMGSSGVRVNAVVPGTVPTSRTLREWSGHPGHFERMAGGVPLGRLGSPDDVAAAITALALDLHHVHGTDLVVDGGQSRMHR